MSESSQIPRFHRRPEARPEELVEAALTVFSERGFRQTTLEEVAQRAGVSKGTVYLYFASKDALFEAVVEKKVIALLESAEAMARAHAGTATEVLVDVVKSMWESMSQTDMVCMARLVQGELRHFPEVRRFYFDHVVVRHRRLLSDIAERGVASGEFRAEALVILPRMVPSLVMKLNQTQYEFGDLDHDAPPASVMRDLILTLVLDGICTPAAGATCQLIPGESAAGRKKE
ncbi:MAG TPA: TetR/AcrR family transcriptional regulator [Gemmatimonadales bacterium]